MRELYSSYTPSLAPSEAISEREVTEPEQDDENDVEESIELEEVDWACKYVICPDGNALDWMSDLVASVSLNLKFWLPTIHSW